MSVEENKGIHPIPDDADIAQFLLKSPLEIAAVLRSMEQAETNIAVHFNHGRDMMVTRILNVDAKEKKFIFDISGQQHINDGVSRADKLLFVGDLNGVKVQFTIRTPSRIQFQNGTAFIANLPADLVKLQRREYFRLTTPIATPYTATFLLENQQDSLSFDLHDISLGGVGVWLKDENQKALFELGVILPRVGLELGGAGRVIVDVEVRNLHTVSLKQGMVRIMLGLKFINLSRSSESLLQRLMVQLERDKKAITG
ncbi:flagellar brake protein [Chitinibacter sp. S2-10]|uniref:flagellar brake protein n=1 Tax=Chitinibacter sp. S2-10 TaxID=3373597 RepID=UPI0039773238